MAPQRRTVSDLALEYFYQHPKEELKHGPVVDYIEEQYLKLYNKKPRDPWRAIRRLYQEGKLQQVRKGVYKYDPALVQNRTLYEFSQKVKEHIFERDNYRCVVCGRGKRNGLEIHADHRKAFDRGGSNTLENGQTLCSEHNLLKKRYSQTEFGKKFLIKIYREAVEKADARMVKFCKAIFDTYNNFEVNSHIKRPN